MSKKPFSQSNVRKIIPASSVRRSSRSGRDNSVLGTTKDGIKILKPPGPATHFTARQIREVIREVQGRELLRPKSKDSLSKSG
jgi:hypothetical protein